MAAIDAVGQDFANRVANIDHQPTATYTDKCSLCNTKLKGKKKNRQDEAIHLRACILQHYGQQLRSEHQHLAQEAGYLTACPVMGCKSTDFTTIGDLGVHLHTHRKTTKCNVVVTEDGQRKICGHKMIPQRNSFQAHMEIAHGLLPLTASQGVSPAVNHCEQCDKWQLGYSESYAHRKGHYDEVVLKITQDPRALGYDATNTDSSLVQGLYCPFCLANEDLPFHERAATLGQRRAQIIHIVQHIMTMAADGLQECPCPFPHCTETFSPPNLADHLIFSHSFRLAGVTGTNQRRNAQSLLIQGDLFKLVMEAQHKKRWEKALSTESDDEKALSAESDDEKALSAENDDDLDGGRVANNLGMSARHPRAPPKAPPITPAHQAYYKDMNKPEVIRICKDKGISFKDANDKYEPHGILIQRLMQAAAAAD